MYSELPFNLQQEDLDLAEQFADHTIGDLRSSLLKLIQTNIVYSYCESLIIGNPDCTEDKIATILDLLKLGEQDLLYSQLSFEVLLDLKKVKDVIKASDWNRQEIIASILELIVDNTLMYSSLAKYAY